MKESHSRQQSRALQCLLSIDDPFDSNTITSHTQYVGSVDSKPRILISSQRPGKQNQSQRRDPLPKVNSSKEELKLILKKLDSVEIEGKQEKKPRRMLIKSQNNQSKTCALKSSRRDTESAAGSVATKKEKSILDIGLGDDIRTMMKQKNYSTNALNLKTMHILQQINTKNSRGYSMSAKLNQQSKGLRKNLVAFLKKVA